MRIGLVWKFGDPEEWRRALDLQPEFTKIGVTVERGWEAEAEYARLCAAAGIRPVIDLRTQGRDWFGQNAPPEAWRWEHASWQNERLWEAFAERCAGVVAALDGVCCDWEVWGEAPCRWVGNWLFEGGNYTRMLGATSAAIREVQSEARVWFGGHGVNGDVSFWDQCEVEGAGPLYQVNNLHCFSHAREWEIVEQQFALMFRNIRGTETERGHHHALATTEFGWPTHADGAGIPFNSHVADSVLSLDEDTAAEWLDRSLNLFEAAGMEEVCVLMLRDGPPDATHWGAHLGLYREDWTPKPTLEVWRKWRGR